MLSSLALARNYTGVTTNDAALGQCVAAADQAVRSYLRRGYGRTQFANWPEQGTDTEFRSGSGTWSLMLKFLPVVSITALYEDYAAYFGQNTANGYVPYASTTQLVQGTVFALDLDDGTQSATGKVIRLSGPSAGDTAGDYGWYPSSFGRWNNRRGTMTAGKLGPVWVTAPPGAYKITYTAGFASDSIPMDLSMATTQLAGWLYNNRRHGGQPVINESLRDYSYQLATQVLNGWPEMGSMRQLLAPYRLK